MIGRTARFAALLLGLSLAGVLAAPMAGAQDPYGSTTTTAPVGEVEASCSLSLSKGTPGTEVTAKVAGVFFGETVRIRFDGTQVAQVTAPDVAGASAGAPVLLGGQALPAQDAEGSTTVTVKFTVPKAAAVGNHVVTAVGDTFTCFCNPNGIFTVTAASKGGLARTGVQIALLLVVAAVLMLVGRSLVSASRRRRRRAHEAAERTFSSVGR